MLRFAESMPPKSQKLEVVSKDNYSYPPKGWTRLTPFLKYETWTPEQGAWLINGVVPDSVNLPSMNGKVSNLANGNHTPQVHIQQWVDRILKLWNSQLNPPQQIHPIDFIEWCKSQEIDTSWITEQDEWKAYSKNYEIQCGGGREPRLIKEHLKDDLWDMKEAVLLLAGYDLKTDCTLNDNKFSPTGIGRVFYLDGLSSHYLNDNGLPDSLYYQCYEAYLKLIDYTRHYDINKEVKRPKDWIKWAIDKDLKPYWLDFVQGIIEHDSIEDVGKKNNSHFDYLTSLFAESPKYFYSDCIAELWATIPEKVYEENEPFWLIRDNHKKQIEDAIINGELEGIIEERIEGSKDDGFQEITDKNRIRKIEKGRLGNNYVVFTVYHDKFKDWLIKSNQWPLADDCLLNKWLEPEAVEDVGLVSHAGTDANNKAEKTPRTRKDNFNRAIDAAILAIGKKPSMDELWRYFQDDKDETGFIVDFTDEKITWVDTNNKLHDIPKKTFANRLSRVNI